MARLSDWPDNGWNHEASYEELAIGLGRLQQGLWLSPSETLPSLLILGVPRSMTTSHFGLTKEMLPMMAIPHDTPSTMASGEWLNRYKYPKAAWPHWVQPDDQRGQEVLARLDKYAGKGWMANDVLQSPCVQHYLERNPDSYRVVIIERPLGGCALSAFKQGWCFVLESLLPYEDDPEWTLENVARAQAEARSYLDEIHGPNVRRVQFDDLIVQPKLWWSTLQDLGYPADRMTIVQYDDPAYKERRELVLARRETEEWQLAHSTALAWMEAKHGR